MDDPLDRSEAAGTSAAPLGGASTGGTYRASDRYPDGRRQTATAAQRRAAAGSGELAGRQVQRTWLAALRTRAEIKPPNADRTSTQPVRHQCENWPIQDTPEDTEQDTLEDTIEDTAAGRPPGYS
ncbi:hypothetical protein AAJCM20276_36730 (plasmid) [Acetobacter aceti]|uniref:Uncharacterized protein n=2 Tax=Acetobacter TaxID=434 RepID=A0A6S6PNJ7_ACEAC|nr:hypothetical protein [Acetobacter aceti]BCI69049.1 hypothetical protein AAJCM20276_36730 [Acetobacter aceti]